MRLARAAVAGATVDERVRAFSALFVDGIGRNAAAQEWYSCGSRVKCGFADEFVFLNDASRISGMLEGRQETFSPLAPEPALSSVAAPYSGPVLSVRSHAAYWVFGIRWTWFSLAFTLGFLIAGDIAHDTDDDWSPPLSTFPHFAFGWLTYAAAAPGMIAVQLFRLSTMNAGPLAAAMARGWRKFAAAFRRRVTANEIERFEAGIAEIKARAQGRPELVTVCQIEEAMKRPDAPKDRQLFDACRRSLDGIAFHLERMEAFEALREAGRAATR